MLQKQKQNKLASRSALFIIHSESAGEVDVCVLYVLVKSVVWLRDCLTVSIFVRNAYSSQLGLLDEIRTPDKHAPIDRESGCVENDMLENDDSTCPLSKFCESELLR